MGFCVCGGAVLSCPFGMTPSMLMVPPVNQVQSMLPLATVNDCKPFVNILPFGMCQSLSNPTVIAATTAALGVLTPMPCIPVIAAPWSPGSQTVQIKGQSALTDTSKCTCTWGGSISINFAGQVTIVVN